MKCFKWIAFVLLIGVNISVAVYLRDYFAVAKLPLAFIALSVCCTVLFVLDVKSEIVRGVTYGILIVIALLGFVYALLYRRPLGFYAAASSTVTFARWFITGRQSSRHNLVTKITWVLTIVLIAFLFVAILYGFWSIHTTGLSNGGSCLWSKSDEALFEEVAPNKPPMRILSKPPINGCWTIWNMMRILIPNISILIFTESLIAKADFASIIPTSSPLSVAVAISPAIFLTDIIRKDNNMHHTWNRVYFNDTWWNVDLSFDDKTEGQKYEFYKLESLTDEDKDLFITFIY